MKSDKEWACEMQEDLHHVGPGSNLEAETFKGFARAIQADALRHAAKVCKIKGNKCEGEGTCCCYGAGNAIEAEAAKLERPQ